jgi:hypothetical protein
MLGIGLILRRRSGAGEIVDALEMAGAIEDFARQRIDDIGFDELEIGMILEQPQVRRAGGLEVVEADDVLAAREQLAQRCEPMNPAPPATRVRGWFLMDSMEGLLSLGAAGIRTIASVR